MSNEKFEKFYNSKDSTMLEKIIYCKCQTPKKKTSEANGQKFEVCSKSLGGCGEEVDPRVRFIGAWAGIDYSKSQDQTVTTKTAWPTDPALGQDRTIIIKVLQPLKFVPITIDVDSLKSPMKECPDCEGGGMIMKCYGGMPIEKKCDYCDGAGEILDL